MGHVCWRRRVAGVSSCLRSITATTANDIAHGVVVVGDNQACRNWWEASVAELNVNPVDLLGVADAYTQLAASAALISPQAVSEVQQIAGTHGVMGYPVAVGVVAGLAKAEGPLRGKIDDFGTYAQRFTEHADVYTTTDADGAGAYEALNFGDGDAPKDPDGHIQAADFDKNHAPVPLRPFDEIQKIPRWTDKDLYPYEPSAVDIRQDAIGDCYLSATMGAVANANPGPARADHLRRGSDGENYGDQATGSVSRIAHPCTVSRR